MGILLRPGWTCFFRVARLYGRAARRANRVGQPSAGGDGPGAVMRSAAGILRIRAGRGPAASGLGPAWSCVPVKTGGNPPVLAFSGGSRRRDAAVFSAWRGRRFPWFRILSDGLGAWFPGLPSGPPEGLVSPAAGAFPPVLPRGRWAALRASRKAGLEGCFFALFARRFPVRRGAPETPGGAIFLRTAKNGPV